jgi:pimeloyl-ACP methyl ester carboxylesterase
LGSIASIAAKILKALVLSGAITIGTTAGAWLNGTDPHQALLGLPGTSDWRAAVAAVAPGVPAPDPQSSSPEQVRRFFSRLSETQRQALTRRDPGVVGNLDGTPEALRYEANAAAHLHTPGRILAYDPRGLGRLIEVFGDLDTADHVAVMVPGVGWNLKKVLYNNRPGKANPVLGAEALNAEMQRLQPGSRTAVVMWLGYDAPEGIDREAMRSERAIDGAPDLAQFLRVLPGSSRITLVGHSYGTVVCGRAIRLAHGSRVGDLVSLASPGMDADTSADLGGSARVWAARSSNDPIELTPHVRLGGFGHGADPVDPAFGAKVFRTGTAQGHGDYYLPGTESLTNVARITLGLTHSVTLA